jgi:hypothetical protein
LDPSATAASSFESVIASPISWGSASSPYSDSKGRSFIVQDALSDSREDRITARVGFALPLDFARHANQVETVDDALEKVWPLVAEEYETAWESDPK